ncbi:MAG: amidase [Ferruginibacter sp.]
MNRRKFLQNSSLAGIVISPLSSLASLSAATNKNNTELSDWGSDDFPLNEVSIEALQQKMSSGIFTSRKITEMYLSRIAAIDKKGPRLHAVLEVNPDALYIADEMDRERRAGKLRGPMHGIPVLIKDNIDTGDKMMTTAGSLALLGHKAANDAFIVKQLRLSGAVLLGKTNLSEWANFRSSRSSSGWSSRGGQTKNPFVLDRSPSGSSSGSAVAVSANLCAVAIGTETNGSIISPASYCGVVGIKPTVGLLSRSGIIPISKTQDTAGPIARTVKDAAIFLSALVGIDEKDAVTSESKDRSQNDYSKGLDKNALKNKRIGIEKSFLTGHPDVVSLYNQAIEVLKKQSAEIIEVELINAMKDAGAGQFPVLQFEFKDGLNKYLSNAGASVKTLADVIVFDKQNEPKAMPYFKQDILESSDAKGALDEKEYKDALIKTLSSRKIIDDMMAKNNLHAIVAVSSGFANAIDVINGNYGTGFYFAGPAAMAGYPHITVPMGRVHELPVGFSFISGAYTEASLINLAYAYEQASNKRTAPTFIKTTIPE